MAQLHKGKYWPKTNWPDWFVWDVAGTGQPAYIECNWKASSGSPVSAYMNSAFMVPSIKPYATTPGTLVYEYPQGSHAGYDIDVRMATQLLDGVTKGRIIMIGALDGGLYAYDQWDFDVFQGTTNASFAPADLTASFRVNPLVWSATSGLFLNQVLWAGIPSAWLSGP